MRASLNPYGFVRRPHRHKWAHGHTVCVIPAGRLGTIHGVVEIGQTTIRVEYCERCRAVRYRTNDNVLSDTKEEANGNGTKQRQRGRFVYGYWR
jgi:hypothetical protein